jgi:hypothetical protein
VIGHCELGEPRSAAPVVTRDPPMKILHHNSDGTVVLALVDEIQNLHSHAERVGGQKPAELTHQLQRHVPCQLIRFRPKNTNVPWQTVEETID